MLAHESRAFADLGYGRVGEGIEEVVFSKKKFAANAFWVDIFIRLKRLLEASLRCGREAPSGKGELWLCRSFGGMISLRGSILRERP